MFLAYKNILNAHEYYKMIQYLLITFIRIYLNNLIWYLAILLHLYQIKTSINSGFK